MKKMEQIPVSVIIPMRNSSTTVLKTLQSLEIQTYPIGEIIVLDNVSKDNSIELVENFSKKTSIPLKLIKRTEDRGVGVSYNIGAKQAKFPLLVFMHSDSELPTKNELTKLVTPLIENSHVVAAYSIIILPLSVWETYNFWQKCLFARVVGKENPGLNGKFDCIRTQAFFDAGGFNEKDWDKNAGGEDADLHLRLRSLGIVSQSKAKIIHLHYLGENYSLKDWLSTRKLLARTYGRLIRVRGKDLPVEAFAFGIKPILTILPFIPHLHFLGIVLLCLFSIFYSWELFLHKSTLLNSRILLLPFIQIFFIYFETFWMTEAFLFPKK